MHTLPCIGEVVADNARLFPDSVGARDLDREMSYREWNRRACRLANALLGLGLGKGDRVAVLAYNCLEWVEIYAATAKAGLVIVPVNFRLVGPEISFIINNCEAAAVIVQDVLRENLEAVRPDLGVPAGNFVQFGAGSPSAGYREYEDLLAGARDTEPAVDVQAQDPWTLMYTSGTTGKPKGVIRSHAAAALLSLNTGVELSLTRRDKALLVMPMCHANSLFFFGGFVYCGGACSIYSRKTYDPEHLLSTLASGGSTFTSLVPTHFIMMLDLPAATRERNQVDKVSKLMISSAPARAETKRAIMDYFKNSGLFELYGSTEAGWVTMLHPDEQFEKLGTVGRECIGSRPIRLLDPDGNEVPDGEPGELYSSTPWAFDGYYGLPEKTAEACREGYCTVGDMARRDADGYIQLVDRKANMIISGGENIYPSEIEAVLANHPNILDVAVIGLPDHKWGERVHAVAVLRDGATATSEEILEWAQGRMAGFKRPRSLSIIPAGEMPRTATGKILHRALRETFAGRDG